MFHELTEFLDSFLKMGIPGVDCIVFHKGREIYRHMNGISDIDTQTPINGKERYYIYSCSKPITCVAALRLWERGAFKLDDELADYMPEFAEMTVRTENGVVPAKNKITVWNLFTMTAGFTYNVGSENLKRAQKETNGTCPTRETMRYLAQDPLDFEPGERWQYSLCHDVLAALVEEVSGMPFEEYVAEHIFTPTGMIHSSFLLPESELNTISGQYCYLAEEKRVERVTANFCRLGSKYASGGGGCVSTVEDYMKFLEAWRQDDVLLKHDTLELMLAQQLNAKQMKTYVLSANYGYGLGVRCPSTDRSDFGWGGAAGAFLSSDRINELSIFHAQHVLNSPNQKIRAEIPGIVKKERNLI